MGIAYPLLSDIIAQFTTTSAGAADGSDLFASDGGQADLYYLGNTVEIQSSATAILVGQSREISGYIALTGQFLVDPPFTTQVPINTTFMVKKERPTPVPINVANDSSVVASDYFAGPVTIFSLSPSTDEVVEAVYADVSGFTDGATLTATISIRIGAGNLARTIVRQFLKGTMNDGTLFAVIDGPLYVKGVATAVTITLTSNNALDVAVVTPITAWY